jgi:hypothetical protein
MRTKKHRSAVQDTLGKLEFIARGCGMDVFEFLATPLQNVLQVTGPYRIKIESLIGVYQMLLEAEQRPGRDATRSSPEH